MQVQQLTDISEQEGQIRPEISLKSSDQIINSAAEGGDLELQTQPTRQELHTNAHTAQCVTTHKFTNLPAAAYSPHLHNEPVRVCWSTAEHKQHHSPRDGRN